MEGNLTALKKKDKDDLEDLLKPVQGGKKGKQGAKNAKVSATTSALSKADDLLAEAAEPPSKEAPEPLKSEDAVNWVEEMENVPSSTAEGGSTPAEFSRNASSSATAPITSKRKQTQQKIILTGGRAGANEALPSAPRAAYEDAIDLSQLPTTPPFSIRFKNAPFESTEPELKKYFEKLLEGASREMGSTYKAGAVIEVNLTDRDGRPSGAGDVVLETRDDLIRLVTYRHRETIRNRKIDILVPWADHSGDQPPRRQGGQRDRDDDREDRTAGKWRDDRPAQQDDKPGQRRSGYTGTGAGENRNFESGWRNPGWQDLPRKESDERGQPAGSSDNKARRPGGGTKFTKFQNVDSSRPSDVEQVSDWRASMKGPLPGAAADEPRAREEREGREGRERREDRGEWRAERAGAADDRKDRPEGESSSPNDWRKGAPSDRSAPAATPSQPAERKKLQLAPRSVNATSAQAAELSERSAALFGGAKPVDTRTKEAEIEHRMEKTRRESESSGKEDPSARPHAAEERSSRSPTPQQRSRTPSPSAPRRSSRTSCSPSSEVRQQSPAAAHERTPSPAHSAGKSPTSGSSTGERAPLSPPAVSDRSAGRSAEAVRRDKETGEPGLEDRANRRRSSQAEDEDRQRPASRSDRYSDRAREEDAESRYPERRRYEDSGARTRGDYDSRERARGEGNWRGNRAQESSGPRDRAEPQGQWRRAPNAEQRGGGGHYGFRDRDEQREQYPSRSSGERYPSRQSDERERDSERDKGYSGQQSRDANYWRQGGGHGGEYRSEQQGARGGWRPGRYGEQQQHQQQPVGRAPIRARDVPERLGPRPPRQQVDDESLAAAAVKEKKGAAGAADVSNRFLLLEDEDAAPVGEDQFLSSSVGADRPASRLSDLDYD